MASLRGLSAAVRTGLTANGRKAGCMRQLSTQPPKSGKNKAFVALSTAAVGLVGYGVYSAVNKPTLKDSVQTLIKAQPLSAAELPESQPSVWSPGKNHALYLWINLKSSANQKEAARVAAKLQSYVNKVVDPSMKDEDDEVLAGVGFGPNFYCQVKGKAPENYVYTCRKGALGEMPSSGGDIFVHAKSNDPSKLFELCQLFVRSLPKDSIDSFEDIYSFVYRNGRDLSGFIDGTENRADDEGRQEVAVEQSTGGSYVITQKWIHNMDLIHTEKPKQMECWVGRTLEDSTELKKKCATSHVARMTSGNAFEAAKPVEIVRQSMPFGTVSGESGLFFIGYAANPKNFEYMLDRMVGAGGDSLSDDIMRLSTNVKGTYWYFPGKKDLQEIASC